MTSCFNTICEAVKATPSPVALFKKVEFNSKNALPLSVLGGGVLATVGAVAAAIFAGLTLTAGSIGLGIGLVAVAAVLLVAVAAAYVAGNYLLPVKGE